MECKKEYMSYNANLQLDMTQGYIMIGTVYTSR